MHEQIPPTPYQGKPFDLAAFARRVVLDGIKHAPTDSEMKARIMLARQCGFLDDEETEDWIAMADLRGA